MKALFVLLLLVRLLEALCRGVWWLADGDAHPERALAILGGLFVAFVATCVVVARSRRVRDALVRWRDRRRADA